MNKATHQDSSLARQDANISQWSPVREFADLRRQMDDFFSRAFGYTPLSTLIPSVGTGLQPEADIYETNDKVIVMCPLPGFEANQIDVQATEDTISVKAERQPLVDNPNARPYRIGNVTGVSQCNLAFSLPDEIDPNRISAKFKNGVLQIEAPKSEKAKHRSVKVNVSG